MDIATVNQWTRNLGESYEELVGRGLITPEQPLETLYPDCDLRDMNLEAGLSLTFWAETKRLETLFVTLIKSTPSTVEYKGDLPAPYKSVMTQSEVHAIFGQPMESRGPIRMPDPMGQTGGWESYLLDRSLYPGKKVVFQYTADMKVKTLVFTLVDKGRG